MNQSPLQPVQSTAAASWFSGTLLPNQNIQPSTPFSPLGSVAATLTVASAASIGSNWVDVRRGGMSRTNAVLNGFAKGVAATVILNSTARSTALQVGLAAGILAGAAYTIDSVMKKSRKELCQVPEVTDNER